MKDCNYKPSGELQGDTKGMPDRGTSTGMNPGADPYLDGMGTGQSDINRIGSIGGATKSDSESVPFGGKSQTI